MKRSSQKQTAPIYRKYECVFYSVAICARYGIDIAVADKIIVIGQFLGSDYIVFDKRSAKLNLYVIALEGYHRLGNGHFSFKVLVLNVEGG